MMMIAKIPPPSRPVRRFHMALVLSRWLAVCLLIQATCFAAPPAASTPNLFTLRPVASGNPGTLDRGVVWQRVGRLDIMAVRTAALAPAKGKNELSFDLGGAGSLPLRMESLRGYPGGGWLAKGRISGVSGSRALFVVKKAWVAATVNVPGDGVYVIQGPEGGDCVVRKLDPLLTPRCGVTDLGFQKAAERIKSRKANGRPAIPSGADLSAGSAGVIDQNATPGIHPLDTSPTTIDIMVVYSPDAEAGGGGPAAMEALAQLAVEEANDCYVNSQINVRLNLVHTQEIPYTETGDIAQDLQNVAFFNTDVKNLRLGQFKADLVCLMTEREDTGYIAGIAYLLQDYSTGGSPEFAYSVVLRAYFVGIYAFAHEVGHNLGCAHDRPNAGGPGTFPYSYGNRFVAQGITYATVMTYPPGVRIPNFSNPSINYNGTPTGIPDGDPNSADNAFTINQTGPGVVSRYYTAARRYNFSPATISVIENAGQVTVNVHMTETSGTTLTRSVTYATSDGTAIAGQDYVSTSGTLTFASGQTDASFTVDIINDTLAESPETFVVSLSNPSPIGSSAVGQDYQGTVVIEDDEKSFYLGSSSLVASEADGGVDITVFRQGATNSAASVAVRPVAGTALAGSDFVAADVVADFAAGETQKSVTIPLINDFVAENDKTFSLNLVLPSAGFAISTPSTASVTLLDDDRPGAFDIAFNNLAGPNDNVFALAARPDGKVIVGGGFARINGGLPAGIAQFNADGSLDTSFNPGIGVSGGEASGTVFTLGLQADGKVVLGGAFTAVAGVTRNNLARLNADGSVDTQFDPGLGSDETVRSLAVMDDGRIVIGGFFTNYQAQSRPYIARVLPGGGLDTTFDPGTGPAAPVRAVVVQADGSVIIGGDFTTVAGASHAYIARLTPNGSLDSTFTASMAGTVRALALTSNGGVLAGGEFGSAGGYGYSYIARLNDNGTTDTSFDLSARPDGFVRAIAVQSDQKILIAGDFTHIGAQALGRIGRLNVDGSVDTAFAPGSGANDLIYALSTDTDSFVVAGGAFNLFSGLPRAHVVRLRASPNVDTFEPVMVPLVRSDVTGGPITIHFEGRSGAKYSLDGSDDLTAWSGIVTNTAPADQTQLTDPAPPSSRRFYRIRRVP